MLFIVLVDLCTQCIFCGTLMYWFSVGKCFKRCLCLSNLSTKVLVQCGGFKFVSYSCDLAYCPISKLFPITADALYVRSLPRKWSNFALTFHVSTAFFLMFTKLCSPPTCCEVPHAFLNLMCECVGYLRLMSHAMHLLWSVDILVLRWNMVQLCICLSKLSTKLTP